MRSDVLSLSLSRLVECILELGTTVPRAEVKRIEIEGTVPHSTAMHEFSRKEHLNETRVILKAKNGITTSG